MKHFVSGLRASKTFVFVFLCELEARRAAGRYVLYLCNSCASVELLSSSTSSADELSNISMLQTIVIALVRP